jgi:hypothetical protein
LLGGWHAPDEFAVPRGQPNRTRFGAYVERTREFELQKIRDAYGSASITMKF